MGVIVFERLLQNRTVPFLAHKWSANKPLWIYVTNVDQQVEPMIFHLSTGYWKMRIMWFLEQVCNDDIHNNDVRNDDGDDTDDDEDTDDSWSSHVPLLLAYMTTTMKPMMVEATTMSWGLPLCRQASNQADGDIDDVNDDDATNDAGTTGSNFKMVGPSPLRSARQLTPVMTIKVPMTTTMMTKWCWQWWWQRKKWWRRPFCYPLVPL